MTPWIWCFVSYFETQASTDFSEGVLWSCDNQECWNQDQIIFFRPTLQMKSPKTTLLWIGYKWIAYKCNVIWFEPTQDTGFKPDWASSCPWLPLLRSWLGHDDSIWTRLPQHSVHLSSHFNLFLSVLLLSLCIALSIYRPTDLMKSSLPAFFSYKD